MQISTNNICNVRICDGIYKLCFQSHDILFTIMFCVLCNMHVPLWLSPIAILGFAFIQNCGKMQWSHSKFKSSTKKCHKCGHPIDCGNCVVQWGIHHWLQVLFNSKYPIALTIYYSYVITCIDTKNLSLVWCVKGIFGKQFKRLGQKDF
jgi:hypothetical protein